MTKRRRLLLIILWIFLISSFSFFASLIFLKVNGLKLNLKTGHFQRTGMIYINGQPSDAQIYFKDNLTGWNLPKRISNLIPGEYEIKISKKGYHPWSKIFKVEDGKVSEQKYIILFKENPEINENTNFSVQTIIDDFEKQKSQIKINNGEIWYQDKLITRFSQEVFGAQIYPDKNHFVVQVSNQIHLIDLDGSNDINILELPQLKQTPFTIKDNGNKLIYTIDSKIYEVLIK